MRAVDDSSGQTIELVVTQGGHRLMMPDRDFDEAQERLWKRSRKPGRIDVGSLIKVKGEIREKWKIRKIDVMKMGISKQTKGKLMLDILTDQNVELQAWKERVAFKRSTLSKPWKLPPSILSKHYNHKPLNPIATGIPSKINLKPKPIDFKTLPLAAHSLRNLKLLILSHINTLSRFTPAELLSLENIHFATTCVANHDFPRNATEREIKSILLGALDLLLRDGNIILPKMSSIGLNETFIVVGKWNLGSTIKSVAKRDRKVVVRELWQKIISWGSGWEGTTKGVVGDIVEEVLGGIQGEEWVESKSGVWTRLA
jgi:hypothetical protein